MDSDLVLKWPLHKLKTWLTFLKVRQELEAEAMKQGSSKVNAEEAAINRLRALQEDKAKAARRRK